MPLAVRLPSGEGTPNIPIGVITIRFFRVTAPIFPGSINFTRSPPMNSR